MYVRTRETEATVNLLRGDAIQSEAVRWLWDGWLAEGKIHLIAGPSGTGKTRTAMAFAATVSSGGRWPSGEWTEARNVVIWTGEGDPVSYTHLDVYKRQDRCRSWNHRRLTAHCSPTAIP